MNFPYINQQTKQFDEMGEKQSDFALQILNKPKIYQRGKGTNEESLDELTSYGSGDMLKDGGDTKLDDLEKKFINSLLKSLFSDI